MSVVDEVGALLCAQDRFATDAHGLPWRFLVGVVLACGGLQGAAMGAFDGPSLQIVVSALKVPILIGVATLLALPSLFVVNTVIGLREDFADVLRAIFTAQATVAIALAALAPVLLFAYASGVSYPVAKALNGLLFLVASVAGQLMLGIHYRELVSADGRHRAGRRLWWFLYALITIQIAWVLRPFIGNPNLPVELLREEAWGNAYVELSRQAVDLLRSWTMGWDD